jgi:hypothetical protein
LCVEQKWLWKEIEIFAFAATRSCFYMTAATVPPPFVMFPGEPVLNLITFMFQSPVQYTFCFSSFSRLVFLLWCISSFFSWNLFWSCNCVEMNEFACCFHCVVFAAIQKFRFSWCTLNFYSCVFFWNFGGCLKSKEGNFDYNMLHTRSLNVTDIYIKICASEAKNIEETRRGEPVVCL